LSADARERRLAFVRERALRDEVSLLKEARQEGRQEGRQQTLIEVATHLITLGALTDEHIAQTTGLPMAEIQRLRQG